MQRFSWLAFALALVVSTLAAASLARADFHPGRLERSPTGPVCAASRTCSHPTDCMAPETCTTVGDSTGDFGTVCLRDTATEIFCCSTAIDCPNLDAPVRCVHTTDTTGGTPLGVCLYFDRTYCLVDPAMLGTGELTRFVACHTPAIDPCTDPIPTTLTDFDDGDCDTDGLRNVEDPMPCVPASSTCLDAGVADGGNLPDLGTDAASAPDMGTSPMDAGALAPPGVSFRGGAGCTCRVARGDGGGAAAFAVTSMLAALVVARRRQSHR